MENNDFRSRLKNHTSDLNPDAWKQMAEMLDAVAVSEQKEKKKRKGWWFFLLPLCALLLVGVLFLVNRTLTNQTLTVSEKLATSNSSAARIESNKKTFTDSESATLSSQANEKPIQGKNLVNSDFELPNASSSLMVADRNIPISKTEKGAVLNTAQLEKSKFSKANKGKAISEFKAIVQERNDDRIFSNSTITDTPDTNGSAAKDLRIPVVTKEIEGLMNADKKRLIGIPPINTLSINQLNSRNLQYPLALDENKEITIPQLSKFSWSGGIGLSDFNGNTGYYFGVGLFWDLDKIIGLESILSYGAAKKEIDRPNEYVLEKDSAIKLQLWIRLYVFKNDKHSVSLDLGPNLGYNTYKYQWGTNSSTGSGIERDFSGGLSYTYFLSNRNGIGLKGAFSRYDSGYAAIKYFIKFK